jgi:hypothetical protein
MGRFTRGIGAAAVTRWTPVFLVPCVLTAVCAVAFIAFVREPTGAVRPGS